jgi:8-oxo-dGTP pyrophosphatase MutT (NUDIX family)
MHAGLTDVAAGIAGAVDRGRLAVLLCKRGPSAVPEWSDAWCLPGGKIERGETPEMALVREWREELSADILVGDLLHAYCYRVAGRPAPIRVRTYAVEIDRGPHVYRLTPDGGVDVGYFTLPLRGLKLLPSTLPPLESYLALLGRDGLGARAPTDPPR